MTENPGTLGSLKESPSKSIRKAVKAFENVRNAGVQYDRAAEKLKQQARQKPAGVVTAITEEQQLIELELDRMRADRRK